MKNDQARPGQVGEEPLPVYYQSRAGDTNWGGGQATGGNVTSSLYPGIQT